jgi:N-acetylmuramic acid 6-phosphate etherase
MIRMGKVYGNLMVDLQVTCDKLQDRGERILMEMLSLERPEAERLLARANGSVKTAIAMFWTGKEREEASRDLAERGGRLGEIMEMRDGS